MDHQQAPPATSSLLSSPDLSPLEQEVLEEYERLAENMKRVSLSLPCLTTTPAPEKHTAVHTKEWNQEC